MIILIGGGSLADTHAINEIIVAKLESIRATGRKPVALLLPQGSFESKPAVNSFYKEFGSVLKCKASCALWKNAEMDYEHVREKFAKADMIYIGGGRFDTLVQEFESMNIRPLLTQALQDGKILVGNSAGAMILCDHAVSDYMILAGLSQDYTIVNGYGYVKTTLCPHADEPLRLEYLRSHHLDNSLNIATNDYIIIE